MWVPSGPQPPSGRRDSVPRPGLAGPAPGGRAGGERGRSMPRGVLYATCSDGARSAASYRGAGAGILTAGGGRELASECVGSPGGSRGPR